MNHGFFHYDPESKRQSMHWKSPTSPRQIKHTRENQNLKQWWSFFSTSEGLFTWIGCLKFRTLTRSTTRRFWQTFVNGWDEGDLKCGRMAHGFFTRWRTGTQRPVCQDVFDKAQDHHVGISTVLTWPSPMWIFYISKDQVFVKRNQVQVHRRSEDKSNEANK